MAPPGAEVFTQPAGILLALTALSFALRWRAIRWREFATFAVFALLATRALRLSTRALSATAGAWLLARSTPADRSVSCPARRDSTRATDRGVSRRA